MMRSHRFRATPRNGSRLKRASAPRGSVSRQRWLAPEKRQSLSSRQRPRGPLRCLHASGEARGSSEHSQPRPCRVQPKEYDSGYAQSDAIDDFLRAKKPDNAVVVQANWRDNPWLPDVLDEERRLDFEIYPERYAHVWEGDYARAFAGAYFARHLEQARKDGRIGHVPLDPVLPVKAFFDIGGAGHNSDAMAIWVCQFVGREISTRLHRGRWAAIGVLRYRVETSRLEERDHSPAA
jgi:hypothetical protein